MGSFVTLFVRQAPKMRQLKELSFLLLCCAFGTEGQGLTCETPKDCEVDPYNPYCSKWGYCTWTPQFGDEGPPQSKGAVEDGVRGQCRDDKDCTPWAPSCSPLGYCRGGVQDGSFGSRTNPKPGGEASDWIKANAKSGAGRNEEYYGKIEDDNRRNHVEFRKKYPKLFPKVSLDRLEEIEENVYSKCTYCKYDPKSGGSSGGSRNAGGGRGGQSKASGGNRRQGASKSGGNRNGGSKRGGGTRNNNGGNKSKNNNYTNDITNGKIPGQAGKDYPNFSLKQLEKKGFKGIQPAPADKIVANYPKNSGRKSNNNSRKNNGGSNKGTSNRGGGGGNCPGSLDDCMAACPSNMRIFKVCVQSCSKRCSRK